MPSGSATYAIRTPGSGEGRGDIRSEAPAARRASYAASTYHPVIAAGATDRMSPRPSPEPGVRMAYVADPEGNLIELLDRTAASLEASDA